MENEYLKDSSLEFKECTTDIEKKDLYEIFVSILTNDNSYAFNLPFSYDDFLNYFFTSKTIICKKDGVVCGGYYMRPNQPGKGSHIANAGYIVKRDYRGQKIGFYLGQHSIDLAKSLNYKGLIFNLVFAENTAAISLWKKLGFKIIGTIPNGIKNPNGSYQDGKIMFLPLNYN